MSKATEQNDKLKRAIIISVALHIILIALLIWSSFDEHLDASAGGGGGNSELLGKINAGLQKIVADGTYAKIYKTWFDDNVPTLPAQ